MDWRPSLALFFYGLAFFFWTDLRSNRRERIERVTWILSIDEKCLRIQSSYYRVSAVIYHYSCMFVEFLFRHLLLKMKMMESHRYTISLMRDPPTIPPRIFSSPDDRRSSIYDGCNWYCDCSCHHSLSSYFLKCRITKYHWYYQIGIYFLNLY